jgi:uncharacterized protein (TIGR02118 family)
VIKVSVLYPYRAGARFDMDYYCDSHMPLVQRTLKPAIKGVAVDKGLAGGAPGQPPSYVAICHLLFDSVDAYQKAFESGSETILSDIPNYTDIEPVVQVSEIMLD